MADIEHILPQERRPKRGEDGSAVTKNGQQFADYVRLLAYSGARRNEALRVRWQDVDFDNEQLHVGSDGDTKNSETRSVDFNAKLKAHLQSMHKRSRQVSQWLFPVTAARQARRAGPKTVQGVAQPALVPDSNAKMPNFHFHDTATAPLRQHGRNVRRGLHDDRLMGRTQGRWQAS